MANIMKRYIEYLKNNPEGYWFKRKLYGWGWTPARLQGWLVTLVFVLAVVAIAAIFIPSGNLTAYFISLAIAIAALILIAYKTGEKPRWSWGK